MFEHTAHSKNEYVRFKIKFMHKYKYNFFLT